MLYPGSTAYAYVELARGRRIFNSLTCRLYWNASGRLGRPGALFPSACTRRVHLFECLCLCGNPRCWVTPFLPVQFITVQPFLQTKMLLGGVAHGAAVWAERSCWSSPGAKSIFLEYVGAWNVYWVVESNSSDVSLDMECLLSVRVCYLAAEFGQRENIMLAGLDYIICGVWPGDCVSSMRLLLLG